MSEHPSSFPCLHRAGDRAWLVDFGERTDDAVNNAVIAFDAHLRTAAPSGVIETAPTIRSVLVRFDPLALAPDRLAGWLNEALATRDWLEALPPEGRKRWHVPVHYGGADGPDLGEVADLLGLSEAKVVADHTGVPQRVRMLGFAPGFVYTGLLGERWNLPRRTSVHPSVPAGSIAVAVRQTCFTSTPIPTGWRVIGRSPFHAFQVERDPPFLLQAGDELVFESIDAAEAARLEARAHAGDTVAQAEPIR
jgi:KipI family sensor histidine kinase inhibitor